MMSQNFDPARLLLARKAAGFNQKQLAEQAGIAQGTVSKLENGVLAIDEEQLNAVAHACGVLPAFFTVQDSSTSVDIPSYLYRSRKLKKTKGEEIESNFTMIRQELKTLMKSVNIKSKLDLPVWPVDGVDRPSASKVAQDLRELWKVPRGPIKNLTQYLEAAGVLVFSMPNLPKMVFLHFCHF